MKSAPTAFMTRLAPLVAVAVLVSNDHVLKQHFPGLITGKLSDFAGLFFFPLFLTDVMRGRRLAQNDEGRIGE